MDFLTHTVIGDFKRHLIVDQMTHVLENNSAAAVPFVFIGIFLYCEDCSKQYSVINSEF